MICIAGLFVVELIRYYESGGINAFFCKSKVILVSILIFTA